MTRVCANWVDVPLKGQLHQDSQRGAGLSPWGFHRAAPLSQNLKEVFFFLALSDPAGAGHRVTRSVCGLSWAWGGHPHPHVTEFNCCLLALDRRNPCLKAQSLSPELSFSRLSWCESLMELGWWIIAEVQSWVWCNPFFVSSLALCEILKIALHVCTCGSHAKYFPRKA